MRFTLNINNVTKTFDLEADIKLIDVLRKENLVSVKSFCQKGICSCCSVLVDDKVIPSCIPLAASLSNNKIVTLEYFMQSLDYIDIKKAFISKKVNMCGYCNTGKILGAYEIIKNNLRPSKDEIKKYTSVFKCQCTEEDSLINAIQVAATLRRERIGVIQNGK